jgi:anti-sigma regulatory factor (Ser/Thr protein kinase)
MMGPHRAETQRTAAPSLWLRIAAAPAEVPLARHRVVEFAESLGLGEARSVGLALTEALSNAITHAYRGVPAGEIEVTAEDRADRLVVAVRDFGLGMAPRADSPGMGVGLPLIGTLTEEVQIVRREDGTDIIMIFTKRPAGD